MEDQRRDIGKGVWFSALMFYSLIVSVLGQFEPSMTLRVSPNMTVQQEGTTVSLLCQVSGLSTSTHFLSWVKEELKIATGKQTSVSDERYHVSFTEGVISVFNLTISQVAITDTGTYACNLIPKLSNTHSRGELEERLDLSVYPRDAFPSCSPNGPAALTAGSPLSCITFGNATPSINGENDEWMYYSSVDGSGAVFRKIAASSDSGKTYVCVAEIPASDVGMSCTIGPLTVLSADSETLMSPNVITAVLKSDLSAGQITGIIIGAVVLIIIIAVHTLCCRCDPRRWMHPKDYLINCGKSKETSQARENPVTNPLLAQQRRNGNDVPPSYSSVLQGHSADVSRPRRTRVGPNVYEEVPNEPHVNTSQTADKTGKPEQVARNPEEFARQDEVYEEVEFGPSQTVIYADLDLKTEGPDEIQQLGKPQETIYAEIQIRK